MFDRKNKSPIKKSKPLSRPLLRVYIMLDKVLFFRYHIALFMLFAPLAMMYNTITLEIAL